MAMSMLMILPPLPRAPHLSLLSSCFSSALISSTFQIQMRCDASLSLSLSPYLSLYLFFTDISLSRSACLFTGCLYWYFPPFFPPFPSIFLVSDVFPLVLFFLFFFPFPRLLVRWTCHNIQSHRLGFSPHFLSRLFLLLNYDHRDHCYHFQVSGYTALFSMAKSDYRELSVWVRFVNADRKSYLFTYFHIESEIFLSTFV